VLTAQWENQLEEIRRGEKDHKEFIAEVDNEVMDNFVNHIIENVGVHVLPDISQRERLEDVKCPLCGNTTIETKKAYMCEKRLFDGEKQTGCPFLVSKNLEKTFGRHLEGQNDIIKLLNSTEDQLFKEERHGVFLDTSSDYFVGVAWDEEISKNEVKETKKTFRKGDKFVFKKFRDRNLTKNQAKNLLDGKTIVIKRKSKEGKEYKVKATLNEEKGSIETVFA
jgi:hypothetical protein